MPTNRQRRTRKVANLSADQFFYNGWFAFMTSWRPPRPGERTHRSAPWKTWVEYFADYDAIRDEFLAHPLIRRVYGDKVPFADQIRSGLLQPGEVYDQHSHKAEWHTHPYTRNDGHVHEGFYRRLGPAVEVREESESTSTSTR